MFSHFWNVRMIETNENLLILNLVSMKDEERPHLQTRLSFLGLVEKEDDYIFGDDFLINLSHIILYTFWYNVIVPR